MNTSSPLPQQAALNDITNVEDPITWTPTWEWKPRAFRSQNWETLGFNAARYWQGMKLDALIMEPPVHNGRTAEIARQVYHRLVARFVGAHAFKRQRIASLIGLAIPALGYPLSGLLVYAITSRAPRAVTDPSAAFYENAAAGATNGLGAVMNLSAFLIGAFLVSLLLLAYTVLVWIFAPKLTAPGDLEEIHGEVRGAVQRCFLRGVPADTPEDLRDVWRHGWLTSESRPLSSEIVDTDATSMVAYDVARGWRACFSFLSVLIALSVCGLGLFIYLVGPIMLLAMFKSGVNPGEARAKELDRQNAVEGSLLVATGGIHWAEHQEKARYEQIVESKRDTTPMLKLGEATGILAGRGDFFAPSAGQPFTLSLRDVQNHVLITGGTGSGKTSGVLRPLAYQLGELSDVGLVVMDGKAALPNELQALRGMRVIDPAHAQFSLVSGLTPVELVDTIADVLRSPGESDPYWSDSAMGLLRRAAVLAQAAGGAWWTLSGIGRLAVSDQARSTVTKELTPERVFEDPVLKEAVLFFADEWNLMDAKPKSGVLSVARSWTATMTAHPDLLKWADTLEGEDSFDLMAPLHGGRLGFLIPGYRYGRAGAVVTALLKARLYSQLKARAERPLQTGETPLVFIIDEAQEVATQDDATMLSIGRSLGLGMIAATQTIEGINDKLGESAAAKWLAVYGNAIGLSGRSRATDAFLSQRAGACWRALVNNVPGASVRDTITADAFSGAMAAARKQPSMREWAGVMEPFSGSPLSLDSLIPQKRQSGAAAAVNMPDQVPRASLGPVPLVYPDEMTTLLAQPNLALAITTRARVPRRDVILLAARF